MIRQAIEGQLTWLTNLRPTEFPPRSLEVYGFTSAAKK